MKTQSAQLKLEDRILAQAIFRALEMFSDVRYKDFLRGQAGKLEEKWFTWFAGEWRVARTIKQGMLDEVCRYLDTKFRQALSSGDGAEAVDVAAAFIRNSGLSACLGKGDQPSLPISLVSKVGFLFCPTKLVPRDGYSLTGLNKTLSSSGIPEIDTSSYRKYLEAFNAQFVKVEAEIAEELKQDWVSTLAKKLGYTTTSLKTVSLKRKVFDNCLMSIGD